MGGWDIALDGCAEEKSLPMLDLRMTDRTDGLLFAKYGNVFFFRVIHTEHSLPLGRSKRNEDYGVLPFLLYA